MAHGLVGSSEGTTSRVGICANRPGSGCTMVTFLGAVDANAPLPLIGKADVGFTISGKRDALSNKLRNCHMALQGVEHNGIIC